MRNFRWVLLGFVFIAASGFVTIPSESQVSAAGGAFTALTPKRLLDTRSGDKVGAIDGSGSAYELQVTGAGGVPGSGVSAVALNVTAVSTEAGDYGGFVTVYPCGTRPDASNLNFTSGQTIPNSVIAPVSGSGKVCFYVYGKAHLLADVSGYFTSGFEPLTPKRLLDTRSGDKVGAIDGSGSAYELQVTGAGGVPGSGVSAVALNVTAVSTEAGDYGGFVTVYPCGTRPDASNLNFTSGQTIPNSVIAPVSGSGKVCFYVYGKAHLLADVSGYFTSGFEPLTPKRLLDTRSGDKVGAIDGSGSAYELQVTGAGGVPGSGVSAVALNVTAVSTEAGDYGGFVTVYPCGTRPDASNLNFTSGQTIPNSVIAPVSGSGKVCFYVYGKAHLLADVSGYLSDAGGDTDSGTGAGSSVSFDFGGAVAVGLASDSQTRQRFRVGETASTNLLAIADDGSSTPALTSGQLLVAEFLVAPNGKLYALLQERQAISTGDNGECLLIQIDTETDAATCVDADLQSINWSDDPSEPAIQFDDDGRIYYEGYASGGNSVLRRFSEGSTQDLINDNISIGSWRVLGDGSVLATGQTTSSSLNWIRKISPSGGLQTIAGNSAHFIQIFPDENAYFGIWECSTISNCGVYAYDTSAGSADMTNAYISGNTNGIDQLAGYNPTFDAQTICDGYGLGGGNRFCGYYGTNASNFVTTMSQKVYALPGGTGQGEPWQYYPTVDRVTTQVSTVTSIQAILNDLLITGTNSLSQQVLVVHDSDSGTETALLDGSNEIEIYNMDFDSAKNRVMFDGLRFSDNKYVVGFVNVATREVTAAVLPGGKLENFAKLG